MVRDDSKRSLDMDEIIQSVKAQYATMASRSREEVENWNKKKVNIGKINKKSKFRKAQKSVYYKNVFILRKAPSFFFTLIIYAKVEKAQFFGLLFECAFSRNHLVSFFFCVFPSFFLVEYFWSRWTSWS